MTEKQRILAETLRRLNKQVEQHMKDLQNDGSLDEEQQKAKLQGIASAAKKAARACEGMDTDWIMGTVDEVRDMTNKLAIVAHGPFSFEVRKTAVQEWAGIAKEIAGRDEFFPFLRQCERALTRVYAHNFDLFETVQDVLQDIEDHERRVKSPITRKAPDKKSGFKP